MAQLKHQIQSTQTVSFDLKQCIDSRIFHKLNDYQSYIRKLLYRHLFLDIEFSDPMVNTFISQDQQQTHAEGFFNSFTFCEDFISDIEESNLVLEVQPHLERQVYEKDHWDEVSNTRSQNGPIEKINYQQSNII